MKHSTGQQLHSMLAALRAATYEQHSSEQTPGAAPPFVTISRQAGAGGLALAELLVERLNRIDPADRPWSAWDNELVQRVAALYRLPASTVAELEDNRPSWLETALGGLSAGARPDPPDELVVFHRVSDTIKALARVGRVVIVGRGGAFITAGMPGGVHLRLVAPLEDRIVAVAEKMGLAPDAAARHVREQDHARQAFYHRHWPDRPLAPEHFTVTFNTAAVPGQTLVDCILPLLGLEAPLRDRPAAQPQAV